MATYAQWRRGADKGEVKRLTWVCGDQRVLVEEIVDTTRQQLMGEDLDYVSFSAAQVSPRDVWASANQYPLYRGINRLVVVRDAEQLKRWHPALEEWLADPRALPMVYLLFVSNEHDFAYNFADGKRAGMKSHLETMQQRRRRSTQLVRCSMPNEEDAIAWAQRRCPTLDVDMARLLLTRAGGNLWTVAGVCDKLSLFDGKPGPTAIMQLCNEAPQASFVDALIAGKKKEALLAAEALPANEYALVIGQLESQLDVLKTLWTEVRTGRSAWEITSVPTFLVKKLLPVAKHYDLQRCRYDRGVLAVIDNAVRRGAREGVLEALVALW